MADEKETTTQEQEVVGPRDVSADVADMLSDLPDNGEAPLETSDEPTKEEKIAARKERHKEIKERGTEKPSEKPGDVLNPILDKATAAPDATQKKFRIGEKEYSAQEIAGSPELIEQLAITHGKHQSLQQKYLETLEQLKKAPQAEAQAPPAQAGITPEIVQQRYAPVLKGWSDAGLIDSEFAEVFPKTAPAIAMIAAEVLRMAPIVARMAGQQISDSREALKEGFQRNLHGSLDALTQEDNFRYGSLKAPEVRQKFLEFLSEEDPKLGSDGLLSKDRLVRFWAGFIDPAQRERMRKLEEDLENAKKRRWIVNETVSSRTGKEPEPTDRAAKIAAGVADMLDL